MPGLDFLEDELADLAGGGRLRSLRVVAGMQGPRIELDGRVLINASSNDYLGLAGDGWLAAAAGGAAAQAGAGAGASRLISGNNRVHEAFEEALAGWLGAEAALVFNSGYQANLGVITALAGRGDLILSDELNHASLIDGCRLSRAEVSVYPHGDVGRVDEVLRRRGSLFRRRIVVSDAIFSMDGDEAPVARLAEVARRWDAIMVLDEAHSVGVFGQGGRGLASLRGVVPDVLVGTLGKSFGSFGAFVAGSARLRKYLLNRARSFVFTTALPPSVIGASAAALEIVRGGVGARLRSQLWARVRQLACRLEDAELLAEAAGYSPIFPLIVGADEDAMACCEALIERGIFAQGIRPPTVAEGTSRLRLTVMATHTEADIDAIAAALVELRDIGLLPRVRR